MKPALLAVVVLGLAASLASAQSVAPATLDRAWETALAILTGPDTARIAREVAAPDPECEGLGPGSDAERLARLRSIAAQWRGRPITWTITGTRARGLVGPPMPAMPTVCMSLERGAWRYAGFIPGE